MAEPIDVSTILSAGSTDSPELVCRMLNLNGHHFARVKNSASLFDRDSSTIIQIQDDVSDKAVNNFLKSVADATSYTKFLMVSKDVSNNSKVLLKTSLVTVIVAEQDGFNADWSNEERLMRQENMEGVSSPDEDEEPEEKFSKMAKVLAAALVFLSIGTFFLVMTSDNEEEAAYAPPPAPTTTTEPPPEIVLSNLWVGAATIFPDSYTSSGNTCTLDAPKRSMTISAYNGMWVISELEDGNISGIVIDEGCLIYNQLRVTEGFDDITIIGEWDGGAVTMGVGLEATQFDEAPSNDFTSNEQIFVAI